MDSDVVVYTDSVQMMLLPRARIILGIDEDESFSLTQLTDHCGLKYLPDSDTLFYYRVVDARKYQMAKLKHGI